MSTPVKVSIGVIAVMALAAGTGYWAGSRQAVGHRADTLVSDGTNNSAAKERRVLYYRNPMGLPDTSPTPKKDPMGMDYVPVYEGESDAETSGGGANQIRISTEKVQKLGVRVEAVTTRSLDKVIRAAARIEPDERRTYTIAPKFEGYVERLHVNVTGQAVGKGQPLFEVYSPELVSAQREYAIANQGVDALKGASEETQRGMRELADSSLMRLRNWDISEEQIKALSQSGSARRTLTFRSPVAGIVTEKKAVQGMRFMPGEMLYQITNLASVWVIADVFEQDIGLVKAGAQAKVRVDAYPDKVFSGAVTYVYPTLKTETRTIPVRVELPNAGGQLKPGMYAQVELPSAARGTVLTVPSSAVIDSGTRQIVLVQLGEGRFEPREIQVGARSEDRVEVVQGVKDGEMVVVAANFLIDAESNLKAAIGGLGHAGHGAKGAPSEAAATKPVAMVGHLALGTVEEIDVKSSTVTIAHGEVPSLKWPAMSMEFKVAHSGLLTDLRTGSKIRFEFVDRGQGDWVITSTQAQGAPANGPHAGHN